MNKYFLVAVFFSAIIFSSNAQTTKCFYLEKTNQGKTEKTKITMNIIGNLIKANLVSETTDTKGQKSTSKSTYEGKLDNNKIVFGTNLSPEAQKFFRDHGVKTAEGQEWILKDDVLEINKVEYKKQACD